MYILKNLDTCTALHQGTVRACFRIEGARISRDQASAPRRSFRRMITSHAGGTSLRKIWRHPEKHPSSVWAYIRATKINLNQLGNLEYHVLYNYLYYICFGTYTFERRWEEKISRPMWLLDTLGPLRESRLFAVPALWKDQKKIKSHIWNKLRKTWHGNHASLCILCLSHTLPSVLGHKCTQDLCTTAITTSLLRGEMKWEWTHAARIVSL